jgi:hypothetical protein
VSIVQGSENLSPEKFRCAFQSALVALAVALLAGSNSARAQTPAAIDAPGEAAIVTLHGEGAQIYECKAGNDGKLAWAFREPIATLLLDDKTVGHHYVGPTWEHVDGSLVVGKAVGNAPGATANDIPWLKLDAVTHVHNGMFSSVTTIQRINTRGGATQGSCGNVGDLRSVPYSADYLFLH